MSTFCDRIIAFNNSLQFTGTLPRGIDIMNPFREYPEAITASERFYRKYYADNHPRHLIIGINPGRFGAGQTGVPFTDPIRLWEKCDIPFPGHPSREASSVFMYEMIDAFGTLEDFYGRFFIHSVCPLGFTRLTDKLKPVNYNYYDSNDLQKATYQFIIENLQKQISLGINREKVICLGAGKNYQILVNINREFRFFKHIIPLEHPRYIIQYKSKEKAFYIQKYVDLLQSLG